MGRNNSSNSYFVAPFIVSADPTQGTHTTLASAVAAASNNQTIFIRDGTYTENVIVTATGLNLCALFGSSIPNVVIVGSITFAQAGSLHISDLRMQTNSAPFLIVNGSAASIVYMKRTYLNCLNNTGITFSSSSPSAFLHIDYCQGNVGATGIAVFNHSSAGTIKFNYTSITNTGLSTTANTASSGTLSKYYCSFATPTTTSGTNSFAGYYTTKDTSAINTTALTIGGSGNNVKVNATVSSGTASAISVSTSLTMSSCIINSTNTNAITGSGTLNYTALSFINSSAINVTTQNPLLIGPTIYTPGITFQNQALTTGDTITNYIEAQSYTPMLSGSTTTGTATYSQQVGYYTQIGKRVFLNVLIQYSAFSGTGNLQIFLPIPARNTPLAYYVGEASFQNVTLPTYTVAVLASGTTAPVIAQIAPGASVMQFPSYQSATTGSTVAAGNPSSGSALITVSINYLVT